jgi:hypothetical protein
MGIIRREAEITSKLADKARAEVFFYNLILEYAGKENNNETHKRNYHCIR